MPWPGIRREEDPVFQRQDAFSFAAEVVTDGKDPGRATRAVEGVVGGVGEEPGGVQVVGSKEALLEVLVVADLGVILAAYRVVAVLARSVVRAVDADLDGLPDLSVEWKAARAALGEAREQLGLDGVLGEPDRSFVELLVLQAVHDGEDLSHSVLEG